MTSIYINLRKLDQIQTIADLGSYVRAADVLSITQPALTRSVQSVERHFGIRLFDRDRGGVHLTAVGRILLERATPLLREARDIEKELLRIGDGEEGEVSLGMTPIVAKAALTDLLQRQLSLRPAARARAFVRSVEHLLTLLRSGQIEFCIATLGTLGDAADFKIQPIAKISNMLAVSTGHPLLAKSNVTLNDIRDFQLICSTYPIALEEYFFSCGVRYQPSVITEDYGTLMDLTLNSETIWLTSPIGCRQELTRGTLHRLPVEPMSALSAVNVGTVQLAGRTISPLAQTMIDEVQLLIERAVDG